MNLHERFERAVEKFGDRVALATGEGTVSYAELDKRVTDRRDALRSAVTTGRPIALLRENGPDWVVDALAILGTGSPLVPVDPKLTKGEIDHILSHSGAGLYVTADGERSLSPGNGIETPPAGTAAILYSSGTTGTPKGVMLTHANFLANVEGIGKVVPFGPEDVFYCVLPLHHAFAFTTSMLLPLFTGGRIAFAPSLKPAEMLAGLKAADTTLFLAVPGILRLLGRFLPRLGPEPFGPRFRGIISGGAALPTAVAKGIGDAGIEVLQGYGLTETSPVVSVNTFNDNRIGTVGRPLSNVEVRIDGGDEGEIRVRGPSVMAGYFRDPERTAEVLRDGWFHTGDIGRIEDGFLEIRGRIKNVIISDSGKNVYPEEIEAELAKSPAIREVCVLGLPTDGSERILAVVIPAEEQSARAGGTDDAIEGRIRSEIQRLCGNLAPYKRVQEVRLWNGEFPKTATQKVKRADLLMHLAD